MLPAEIDYYSQQDRNLNYAALAFAVYSPREIGPEYAISRIEADRVGYKLRKAKEAETLEIMQLREHGYGWRTIAKMMGFNNSSTVFRRVQRWRDKHNGRI